ncbi:MAG: putative DNA binding domain-containing protein [Elusimicrobia bacterium]|nr:putative DNA binding domain-containing protein [Elusimicrobiota bacterium]
MTPQELDALLNVRSESEHLEFKEAKNRYDFEELVGYCIALANEGGGLMVLGVTDKPPRQVVGTKAFDVPERTVAGIFERIHVKVLWHEIPHPRGRALVFEVPSRPVGQPLEYKGRYLMRAGEKLAPMSPDQLKRILDEVRPDFCEQPARIGCGEEEVVTLLDVQSYFDLRKRPLPSTRKEALETFVQKGFLRAEGGAFTITNLGAMLFAKNLGNFKELARKAVRVIVYDGSSKARVKDGKDITGQKGYAAGFDDLMRYILDQLPASEAIAAALRTTTHAYPKKAIREIVGNAIVHQDLNEQGTGVTVEVYDDRIEVTNPGLPILPVDRFIDENQSRNERFANALRQLGICEERGHGMDEVVAHIEVFQLPPYAYRLGTRHTTIILSRYKPLKDLTPNERIYAVYQHCCLRFVNNKITNNESIRGRFKIEKQNAATASRLLAEAVAAKKIRPGDPKAANKLMRYVPYWA